MLRFNNIAAPRQTAILNFLTRHGPTDTIRIAAAMGTGRDTTLRSLHRLRRNGLVRVTDENRRLNVWEAS